MHQVVILRYYKIPLHCIKLRYDKDKSWAIFAFHALNQIYSSYLNAQDSSFKHSLSIDKISIFHHDKSVFIMICCINVINIQIVYLDIIVGNNYFVTVFNIEIPGQYRLGDVGEISMRSNVNFIMNSDCFNDKSLKSLYLHYGQYSGIFCSY